MSVAQRRMCGSESCLLFQIHLFFHKPCQEVALLFSRRAIATCAFNFEQNVADMISNAVTNKATKVEWGTTRWKFCRAMREVRVERLMHEPKCQASCSKLCGTFAKGDTTAERRVAGPQNELTDGNLDNSAPFWKTFRYLEFFFKIPQWVLASNWHQIVHCGGSLNAIDPATYFAARDKF